jgi:hypothetical protein
MKKYYLKDANKGYVHMINQFRATFTNDIELAFNTIDKEYAQKLVNHHKEYTGKDLEIVSP